MEFPARVGCAPPRNTLWRHVSNSFTNHAQIVNKHNSHKIQCNLIMIENNIEYFANNDIYSKLRLRNKKKCALSRKTLSAVFGGVKIVLLTCIFLPSYFFFQIFNLINRCRFFSFYFACNKKISIVPSLPVLSLIAMALLVLDLWFHFSLMIEINLTFNLFLSSFAKSVCTFARGKLYCPSHSCYRLFLIVFLEVQL